MKKLGVTAYWEDLWSMYMTSERLSFHCLSRTPSFMNVKQDGLYVKVKLFSWFGISEVLLIGFCVGSFQRACIKCSLLKLH